MDFIQNFQAGQDDILAALVNTTRSVAPISAEDVAFHRASNASVGPAIDRQISRLFSIASNLLKHCASAQAIHEGSVSDADAVDTNWGSIEDAIDGLLEKADISLDEFSGLIKARTPAQQTQVSAPGARSIRTEYIIRAQNIVKPQSKFEQPPSNHETPPFRPFLESKPWSIIPLESSLEIQSNEEGLQQYSHPYRQEIERYQYPQAMYEKRSPQMYHAFENTQATYVDDWKGVLSMLGELKKASEIAIDLEHHDAHSYIGIVSLMQISTRDHDWIIDTLKPWRRKLQVLNEVFANPNIVKVLHGAHMDIIWLQRDLGLYVVGLFDTHHASRVLCYPGGSLAFLLKKFIDFDAQKQYQTADWRLRPLPPEMFDYARSDTHFLLYIYDIMRNELIENSVMGDPESDKLQAVLEKSKETSLRRYEYPVYDAAGGWGRHGWLANLQRHPVAPGQQTEVFKKVHQWRDNVARQEDESPYEIMPTNVICNIAKVMPDNAATLLSVAHSVSQPVRARANELLEIIRDVKTSFAVEADRQLETPQIQHMTANVSSTEKTSKGALPETSRRESPNTVNDYSINADASRFWGMTLNSCLRQNSDQVDDIFAPMHLAVPIPEYVVSTAPSVLNSRFTNQIGTQAEEQVVGVKAFISEPNVRIVDPLSQPAPESERRKGVTVESSFRGSGNMSDLSTVEEELQQDAMRNVRRKIEQKAARAGYRSGSRTDDAVGMSETKAVQSFDYSTAPSVLYAHQQRGVKGAITASVNPYSKGNAGALGVKRSNKPVAGRTLTFAK